MTIYNELEKKYIIKKNMSETRKMKRNLQPEIEKIKSINQSLLDLGYVSEEEKTRLKNEVSKLLSNIDYY